MVRSECKTDLPVRRDGEYGNHNFQCVNGIAKWRLHHFRNSLPRMNALNAIRRRGMHNDSDTDSLYFVGPGGINRAQSTEYGLTKLPIRQPMKLKGL